MDIVDRGGSERVDGFVNKGDGRKDFFFGGTKGEGLRGCLLVWGYLRKTDREREAYFE